MIFESINKVMMLIIVIKFIEILVSVYIKGNLLSVLNIIILSINNWKINMFDVWLCFKNNKLVFV